MNPLTLTENQARLLRLRAQRLSPLPEGETSDIPLCLKEVCGMQAQDPAAAISGMRIRTRGLTAHDIENARVKDRTIVRTWLMRSTLHLVATEDLGWLTGLLGPLFRRGNRRRRLELGLDDSTTTRGVTILGDILAAQGPLTRAELVEQLAQRGIKVEGQAAPHLLMYASLMGVICLGPDHGGEPTYVLVRDWLAGQQILPEAKEPAWACRELALRYLAAFGPAGPEDMATWSGLPIGQVRTAWEEIAGELREVLIGENPAWLLKSCEERLAELPLGPVVRLAPRFDTYLLGYRDRKLVVAPQFARRVHPGGGLIYPVLLIDGRAEGIWQIKRARKEHEVIVEPFETSVLPLLPVIEEEVGDLGRFLAEDLRLRVVGPSV